MPNFIKFSKDECMVAALKLVWVCIAFAFNTGCFTKHLYTTNAVLEALPILFTFDSWLFINAIRFLAVFTA